MDRPPLEYIPSSKIVSQGPALLYGIWLINTTAGKYLKVYDGQSTSGTLKLHMFGNTNAVAEIIPPVPVLFSEGIYFSLESDKAIAMVQYMPLSGKNALF
jgi:hypothetical protein